MKTLLLAAGLILSAATPAFAADQGEARAQAPAPVSIPAMLSASERENYRVVFADLRAQNWAGAAGRLDGMRERSAARPRPGDALHHAGLAPGRAEPLDRIARPRARAAPGRGRSPGSPALRGAEELPALPYDADAFPAFPASRAAPAPRPIRGDTVADAARAPDPAAAASTTSPFEAETLLNARSDELTRRGAHRVPAAHRLGLFSQRL